MSVADSLRRRFGRQPLDDPIRRCPLVLQRGDVQAGLYLAESGEPSLVLRDANGWSVGQSEPGQIEVDTGGGCPFWAVGGALPPEARSICVDPEALTLAASLEDGVFLALLHLRHSAGPAEVRFLDGDGRVLERQPFSIPPAP